MKLSPEDNPQEPDDFLDLLLFLYRAQYSVNLSMERGEIAMLGTTDPDVLEWAMKHYHRLEHLLPGICDGCGKWVPERTESYWGAHPHFCFACLAFTIRYFEDKHKWPEGTWWPHERFPQ